MTTVHSLASGLKIDYPLPPREAVAAAYAQYAKNDPIAFTHREEFLRKYSQLVSETERIVAIGDFVALRDDGAEGKQKIHLVVAKQKALALDTAVRIGGSRLFLRNPLSSET